MTRLRAMHDDRKWLAAIAMAWFAVIAAAAWPAGWWFSVGEMRVLDTHAGVAPIVIVDRTIRRDFRGKWLVTVMREGAGGFYVHCTARGENDYRTDSALPVPVDLDWWTTPRRCVLPPGSYYLRTLWTIHPTWLPAKEVRTRSNVFRVRG